MYGYIVLTGPKDRQEVLDETAAISSLFCSHIGKSFHLYGGNHYWWQEIHQTVLENYNTDNHQQKKKLYF